MKLTTDIHNYRSTVQPYSIWPNCFSEDECARILESHDSLEIYDATVGKSSIDQTIRKSKCSFHYKNLDNTWLFEKLLYIVDHTNDLLFQFDLLGFEKYQYTLYDTEDYYNYHVDTIYHPQIIDKESHLTRKLSVSIVLNSDYQGGKLELCYGDPDQPYSFDLTKGTALFFPSYALHRVSPIISGVRKSLVVWAMGPKFK